MAGVSAHHFSMTGARRKAVFTVIRVEGNVSAKTCSRQAWKLGKSRVVLEREISSRTRENSGTRVLECGRGLCGAVIAPCWGGDVSAMLARCGVLADLR